ncbi:MULTISPECIES: hypothetical protein [Streptomyces]|uniref:hypothetical protein n=1 Tax=Streptomyces TaxID=1883 RepID=UPI0033CEAB6E
MSHDHTAPANGFTLKDVIYIVDRLAQFNEKAAKTLRGMIRAQKDAEIAYKHLREVGTALAQGYRDFTAGMNRASS